jgi:PAS domain S-box-containing protein
MSDPKARWKPQAVPQGRLLEPFIGALSKQALSKRGALIGEIPGRARKSGRRSRAEGLLRQSEDAFRQLFDISPNALVLWRLSDSTVIMFNVAAAQLFGRPRPHALARQTFDFLSAVEQEPRLPGLLRGGEGAGGTVQLKNAAGDAFLALISSRNVMFHGEPCILTSVVSITARKNMENDLCVSEARFRDLTEMSADWFWEQDENYRFTMLSGNLLKHTGVGIEARLGKTRWDIPALNLTESDWDAHRAVLDARQPFSDFEMQRPDSGGRQHWVSISGMPMFDATGKFLGYRGVGRDITERKRAESALARLNADLEARIAERTAELARSNQDLESFSYSVAHDLRAPLRVIVGFGRLILEDHGSRLPADALGNLQRVLASASRMGRMIDDLLQLSRLARQPLSLASVDIAAFSRELIAELAGTEPARSVSVVAPDSLPAVGDTSLLKVALQNLLGNAWKFTSGAQQTRIEIGEAQTVHGRAFFVRDNGAGFDMAYAGRLFKVFQHLHSGSEFEGTGVGLATVKRIIRRHEGRIWAESAPGLGATFYFTLPAPVHGSARPLN